MTETRRVRWYWFHFDALPITVHLQRDVRFQWQWICGLQVGPWFIGAIRGHQSEDPV